ncbi:DUF6998 domain-containing protein [Pseudokordiimonas caeni]|uniref:DUF6998 domain-containing protein n=1 Tax=Pseudokordiimonas caeni TaxID=2997908 RepID=UPI002811F3D9|nr:hypothetical protein [Pseudokordiimonas caeni]
MKIKLPAPLLGLHQARMALKEHYDFSGLDFTLDGKLVGDIGEAIVAEYFGITLSKVRTPGIDGHAADGRSVQIKATGKQKAGPAFSPGKGVAEHLIFLWIDFEAGEASVLYNGPEAPIRATLLPPAWTGTKVISRKRIIEEDAKVPSAKRLRMI